MQIGVTFPQTEIGNDPNDIRDYTQAVEAMGYRYILAYDHVLGAALDTRPDWTGPYNSETAFHEPFVLFSFMAGITRTISFATGVIILPQRQTALVAKQAAALDVLSGGRFRLGIGVGWNDVEYQALGEDFSNRGARCEEQILVLRALWREKAITFNGRWHTIDNAGINPLPTRRDIPIWIGGYNETIIRRIGRLGDGWTIFRAPDDAIGASIERMRGYAVTAGRKPDDVGVETAMSLKQVPETDWEGFINGWRALNANYLAVNTMGQGFTSLQQHLDALKRVADVAGVTP
ncbi:MAG: LLM class F420-dependent oxidoreductase [Roseiflexaceae bacterium]|nr:LLM class F420-dependent oxidoreductase [Roseiflexaceae bacterium]